VAYGELGLKPWEFERLTLHEFWRMVEGARLREQLEAERDARLIAWLNPRGGKTPQQILNRPTVAQVRQAKRERRQRRMTALDLSD
jgi:hypothetical protein